MEECYYLDSAFAVNFGMDYLLLELTGLCLKRRIQRKRKLAGSALGAVLACAVGIGGMKLWLRLPVWLLGAVLICRMAFMSRGWRLFKDTGVFLTLTFVFGGMLGSLEVTGGILLLGFTVLVAGLLRLVLYLRKEREKRRIYRIELELFGNRLQCMGLLDTGNGLYEPFKHRPVIVCAYDFLGQCMEDGLREHPEKTCVIPYCSVGKQDGILMGAELSALTIFMEEGEIRQSGVVLALTKQVTASGEYQVILHPDLL